MHLLATQPGAIDDGSAALDLGQTPGDIVVLSAADSEIAGLAAEVNSAVENIGARRLHTVMEKLLEEISFTATDRGGTTIVIDRDYVEDNVAELARNADLSKFIL